MTSFCSASFVCRYTASKVKLLSLSLRPTRKSPRSRPSVTALLRAGMQQHLDLVEETVAFPTRTLTILRPRSAEALLDEEAFEHEEFLPYWAELWSSGEALAHTIARRDVA